jgi:hypothetical protein
LDLASVLAVFCRSRGNFTLLNAPNNISQVKLTIKNVKWMSLTIICRKLNSNFKFLCFMWFLCFSCYVFGISLSVLLICATILECSVCIKLQLRVPLHYVENNALAKCWRVEGKVFLGVLVWKCWSVMNVLEVSDILEFFKFFLGLKKLFCEFKKYF